jgi:hypothetical protein
MCVWVCGYLYMCMYMMCVWVCARVNMYMHAMRVWVCCCMCVDGEKEGGESEGGEGGRVITRVDICRSSEPLCMCVCVSACVCACVPHTLLSDPPSVYLPMTFSHTISCRCARSTPSRAQTQCGIHACAPEEERRG